MLAGVVLLCLLCGCDSCKYQGTYLGPAFVTPARTWAGAAGMGMELNVVGSIPGGGTAQAEVIQSLTDSQGTAFRLAANWRVPFRKIFNR